MSSRTQRRCFSHAEILEKIRSVHSALLDEAINIQDFLTTINSLALDRPDAYLAAVSAITSALVFGTDFSDKIPKLLAKSIAKIIECEAEVVRRSCLTLLFLFSKTEQFQDLMDYLARQFDQMNIRAQEMLLSFAFSFNRSTVACFEPLIEHAEFTKGSSDELLASTSEDFLFFMQEVGGNELSDEEDFEPKAIAKVRQSIDIAKQSHPQRMEEIEPDFEDEDEAPAEYQLSFLDDNIDWENAEPPKSANKMRSSVALKKSDVTFATNPEFSPRKLVDEPKFKPPRTAPPKQKRDTMELSMPSDSPRKIVRKDESMSTTVSSPPRSTTIKPKTATRARSGPTSSDDNLMSPKKKRAPSTPPVPELVEMMRDKDWEKQQKAIDTMTDIIANDPNQLAASCKEIWLNLIDLVSAARTTLANASLQFANSLYEQFSQQLAPQTAQPIATLLTQACSMHQFLADGASAVLLTIADKSPRGRVFTPFLAGAKHKNPTGRARSVQCLAIICDSDVPLEDKEFTNVIKAVAPLVRDTKSECREAAKRCLKVLSSDERFWSVAKRIVSSSQELNDMKRMIE